MEVRRSGTVPPRRWHLSRDTENSASRHPGSWIRAPPSFGDGKVRPQGLMLRVWPGDACSLSQCPRPAIHQDALGLWPGEAQASLSAISGIVRLSMKPACRTTPPLGVPLPEGPSFAFCGKCPTPWAWSRTEGLTSPTPSEPRPPPTCWPGLAASVRPDPSSWSLFSLGLGFYLLPLIPTPQGSGSTGNQSCP